MPLNAPYVQLAEVPTSVPVFPLAGALLLPRGELPLNIFEPRYLAMIDDALKSDRVIGVIQPALTAANDEPAPALLSVGCLGRISQWAETGDGRYILNLTGVARFKVEREIESGALYRRCLVTSRPFATDLQPGHGEEDVDRMALISAFRAFARARNLEVNWTAVEETATEALVTMLSMMGPFGAQDKQTLLEAPDLRVRAQMLIGIATSGGEREKPRAPTLH